MDEIVGRRLDRFGTCRPLLLLLMLCLHAGLLAQDRPSPPLLKTAGRFTAARLSARPVVDGREWTDVDVQTTADPGAIPVPARAFTLTATNCGDRGDFVRCELLFQSNRAGAVRVDRDYTGWAYVTPDARFVFTEPLYALDVAAWKQYALFQALGIANYVSIEAISRDGRRLLVSRKDCSYDCRDERPPEYFELTLPNQR